MYVCRTLVKDKGYLDSLPILRVGNRLSSISTRMGSWVTPTAPTTKYTARSIGSIILWRISKSKIISFELFYQQKPAAGLTHGYSVQNG